MSKSSLIFDICKTPLKKDILFICRNEAEAASLAALAKYIAPMSNIMHFPAWDTIPYDRLSPNKNILSLRARILSKLSSTSDNHLIFSSPLNLIQKLPPKETFHNKYIRFQKGQIIGINDIAALLVKSGFNRVPEAIDPGEFAIRGEIFDVVISKDEAYRLSFEWDKLSKIRMLDPLSQISSTQIDFIEIYPSSELILDEQSSAHFKSEFLRLFTVNEIDNPIYEAISNGKYIAGSEQLISLCYKNMISILDYLKAPDIISSELEIGAILEIEEEVLDLYSARKTSSQFYPTFPPEQLYFEAPDLQNRILEAKVDMDTPYESTPDFYKESSITGKNVASLAKEFFSSKREIHIFCPSNNMKERIKQLLEIEEISTKNISFPNLAIENGFITEKEAFFRYQDFIGERKFNQKNSAKRLKNIINELEHFQQGDLIVHEEHGIGKFISVENISATGIRHDFIKLIYDGDDKLYIPVENIDSIKKYGGDTAPLDKLGGVNWQKRKAKLKNRIGDLAQKLISIAAMRKTMKIEPISINGEAYQSFAKAFPYTETEDQLSSIADIEKDLENSYPMDRMICGDVGFGKTEVAMRAAFLVAQGGKQVVVISPTTILTRQHILSFRERFAKSNLNIVGLSRLTPRQEQTNIIASINNGDAKIIIGTHALLNKNIKFKNLGMVIVDEEQHFGVLQKERLKELKSEIHFLAMSATPIPRSLQMSVLGIKDLSLIATPPIDRLSVRTNIIPNDSVIIRDALLRENTRGGRSFFVVPRIKDIEDIEKQLNKLVPELKYVVAHGKMLPSTIDKIMNDFYQGKYDILLSTTIIESGIDIAAANTIIIYKSEMLGLSQLYQLRGRVGRGKVRGFAYLIIGNSRRMTKQANKRLDIMENIDSLGAGFTIASHDSDIRGFGNLVGDEQSGHIKEVGSELYQEMLEDAISDIQNTKKKDHFTPNLNIEIPVFIPNEYIEDSEIRLSIYKRISALSDNEEIENFKDELIDRFGEIPESTRNLLSVMKLKSLCKKLKVIDLDSGPNGILLKFIEDEEIAKKIMLFISKNPGIVKIRPDNKLVIIRKFKKEKILDGIYSLLEDLSS